MSNETFMLRLNKLIREIWFSNIVIVISYMFFLNIICAPNIIQTAMFCDNPESAKIHFPDSICPGTQRVAYPYLIFTKVALRLCPPRVSQVHHGQP